MSTINDRELCSLPATLGAFIAVNGREQIIGMSDDRADLEAKAPGAWVYAATKAVAEFLLSEGLPVEVYQGVDANERILVWLDGSDGGPGMYDLDPRWLPRFDGQTVVVSTAYDDPARLDPSTTPVSKRERGLA